VPVKETVPFLDLSLAHEPLKGRILADIAALLDTNTFVNGPQIEAFERAFADYCGRGLCVGVSSGLDAIRLGLLAAGIGAGDEVIVPANTFVATLEAVSQAGGVPVLVDVTEADFNLDVAATAAAVTDRTRFLLPVHLYGQMADMAALNELATTAGVQIVEDACQAHGARRDGMRPGDGSIAAAFSFYPGKNLGAIGDAGALVTDDEDIATLTRALREHGQRRRYQHELEGYTARLDTIQALVLLHKLPLLDGWNDQRRAAAAFYTAALDGIDSLKLPPVAAGSEPVWHLYVVRTPRALELAAFLADHGITVGRHYPTPPHLSPAYARLGHPAGAFPVTERLAREGVSLPIFPGIRQSQLTAVTDAIAEFFRTASARRARTDRTAA
jgi:dTDP-4-amino-4,6-dideoxygalactose transaminase